MVLCKMVVAQVVLVAAPERLLFDSMNQDVYEDGRRRSMNIVHTFTGVVGRLTYHTSTFLHVNGRTVQPLMISATSPSAI